MSFTGELLRDKPYSISPLVQNPNHHGQHHPNILTTTQLPLPRHSPIPHLSQSAGMLPQGSPIRIGQRALDPSRARGLHRQSGDGHELRHMLDYAAWGGRAVQPLHGRMYPRVRRGSRGLEIRLGAVHEGGQNPPGTFSEAWGGHGSFGRADVARD